MRAYAAHRRRLGLPGATHRAVQKALATGRIARAADGGIDPVAADAAWAASTAPQAGAGNDGEPDYQRARALREVYEARLKMLVYKQRAGALVDAADVRDEAFRAARTVRDALLSMPARLESILAAESDPVRVRALLEDELRLALSTLVDQFAPATPDAAPGSTGPDGGSSTACVGGEGKGRAVAAARLRAPRAAQRDTGPRGRPTFSAQDA